MGKKERWGGGGGGGGSQPDAVPTKDNRIETGVTSAHGNHNREIHPPCALEGTCKSIAIESSGKGKGLLLGQQRDDRMRGIPTGAHGAHQDQDPLHRGGGEGGQGGGRGGGGGLTDGPAEGQQPAAGLESS